jgi:maltooligosyltrehalose trehalohydrolase
MPGGAELSAEGAHFRLWAPEARDVEVIFEDAGAPLRLEREDGDYFSGFAPGVGAGSLYRYRLDGKGVYPDPYSRFQPRGPHGPSMIVDPAAYRWRHTEWAGIQMPGQVLYEMHVGAFTAEGTFEAAGRELRELADLGVTCIELMPIYEFPGAFNWGYDAVDLYAPYHGYGNPEALKRFVDDAHGVGLAVVLDVVYNHLGADGNFLPRFSRHYFTDRYQNDWGQALNFDGEYSGPVRELFIENAAYWVREFHVDGLRLDATQSICDASRPHIIAELIGRARATAAPRSIVMIGENEPQRAEMLGPDGLGLDGLWNDDFHHSARVALTGSHDGYFHDHRGRAQELLSAVKYGFLFQGQYYCWQKQPRGSPALDRPSCSFVAYIQNHDQVANTFYGLRLQGLTSPGRLRAMTALLLLGPHTPMLFMGQEFNASALFAFFADNNPELARLAWQGRRDFIRQFTQYATPAAQACVLDPADPRTFARSKLDFSERARHADMYALHRDLLKLRRDPVIAAQSRAGLDGAVLAERCLLLRWFDTGQGDRLLLVNLGDELDLSPAPEPLLAPPRDSRWELTWSSEEPRYGGGGAWDPCQSDEWRLPAESALFMQAR